MNPVRKPLQAKLLVGPTGVGKTPLGQWLEQRGVLGVACHHFDFGANLRAVVAAGSSQAFNRKEIEFLRQVLNEGALLEEESYHLAGRILTEFLSLRRVKAGHWLVLNGLPRHIGQAQWLETTIRVAVVVQMECDAITIRERLRLNAGGDRAGRSDEDIGLLGQKLEIFEQRSRPLLEYYRERGARVVQVEVGLNTQPQDIAAVLEQALGRGYLAGGKHSLA